MPSSGSERIDGATTGGNEAKPERRLHATSWIFGTLTNVKALLVPLLAAMVIGSSRDFSLWAPAAMLVPLVGAALWKQRLYRYGFSAAGLVIREGLFFRNERTIDYGRIENVDTERGLLHRLLGVAEVRVETSTGGSAEARIRVLDLDAVEDMRARIFGRHGHAAETTEAALTHASGPDPPSALPRVAATDAERTTSAAAREETLLVLTPGELIRFGLIDNRGMLVVAALLGVLAQGGFFENMEEWAGPLFGRLPLEELVALSVATQALLGVATALFLITATRLLSILLAFTTLFDFRLTRAAGDLHTRYGLLTRISITLRQRRIQAVHQTATLLHRLFGRVSLRVDLAGGVTGGNDAQQQGARSTRRELWLAPLCPPRDVERLIRIALPQVTMSEVRWRTLAPRARWRIFRVLSLTWLAAASVPAAWLTGWWAAAILPSVLPLFWLHANLYVKHTGWALHEEFFALKNGWLTRKLAVAPRDRIQSVHLRESLFDRRYRMTQVNVDHAGATASSHRLVISYLDRNEARRLAVALYRSPTERNDCPDSSVAAPRGLQSAIDPRLPFDSRE